MIRIDHADLREPARQGLGSRNELAERNRTVRKGGILASACNHAPMRRCGILGRRVQIVAKRGAKRMFVTGFDPDVLDDGRPIVRRGQELQQRRQLRLDLLTGELGIGQRGPQARLVGTGLFLAGFRVGEGRTGLLDKRGKTLGLGRKFGELCLAPALGLQLCKLLFQILGLRFELRDAACKARLFIFQAVALGARLGKVRRCLAQCRLGLGQHARGSGSGFPQLRLVAIVRAHRLELALL